MYNYHIGIDVAKDIHYATILDSKQTVLVPPFPLHNTSAGLEKLLAISSDYDNALFVMESTGRYHYNLYHYLYHFEKTLPLLIQLV